MLNYFYYLFVGEGHTFFPRGPNTPFPPREVSERNIGYVIVANLPPAASNCFSKPSPQPTQNRGKKYLLYTTNIFIYLVFKIFLNILYSESCEYATGQV